MTYELQSETRPSAPTPAIKEENEDGELEHLSFEERVRATHDEFNFTLLNLLKEIGNQQQDHFSGNILHILNRYFAKHFVEFILTNRFLIGWTSTNFTRGSARKVIEVCRGTNYYFSALLT